MAFGFSESKDSLTLEQRVAQLERKVDSLQVALAKYAIKKDNDAQLTSDKFMNWGRGITAQIHANGKAWGMEAGYTFVTKKFFRMGLLYGGEITFNDTTFPRGAFYGKTVVGTPVFLNFMSIEAYFKMLVYPEGSCFNSNIPEHTRGGGAAGVDFGFWITPHMAVLAGAVQNFGKKQYQYSFFQLSAEYTFGKSKKHPYTPVARQTSR